MDFKDLKGLQWAYEVVNGDFVANKWVKLECQRYIDRIETLQYNEDFNYYFDLKEAQTIYGLLKYINFATGVYANKPMANHLAGYQWMVIENVFCWFDKDAENPQKMIQEVYLQMGRKSSKSVLCALLEILIMLRAPAYSQHAIAGLTRDISGLIKKDMEKIINCSPKLKKYFKITREQILCKHNQTTCKNLSGEANNINGLLLETFLVDEVANQPNQDIIGALKLSQMSTTSRLACFISTAYDLEHNAFYELIDYAKKILDGTVEDIHTFALIFELDEGDDYTVESNWIKASPLQMTLESGRKFLRDEFNKALEVPSKMAEFRIKILNERLSSSKFESFIDIQTLKKCKADKPYDWNGKKVYLGLDMAQTNDNVSVGMCTYDDKLEKIVVKSWCFIPSEKTQEKTIREKVDYFRYIREGHCHSCGDYVVSYSFIENFIMNIENEYGVEIVGIGYDRYNCISTANKLENAGYTTIEVRQHSSTLHPALKWLEESILQSDFIYEDNELLEINFSNCRTVYDNNMNKYINKKKSTGKIDMVIALVNALYLLNLENTTGDNFGAYIL